MGSRTCDGCGESFDTLTRLRLHDCPDGGNAIEAALLPEPQPDQLPERALEEDEYTALADHDRIDSVTNMMNVSLPGDKEALSFVLEIDGYAYGLHCDHDTAEWEIIAEGDDLEDVGKAHGEWLAEDVSDVADGASNPGVLQELGVPDEFREQ
jgi:hypothetical protein